MGNSEISYSDVMTVAGVVNDEFIGNAVDAIKDKDINKILEMVDRLVMDGKDITQFVSDLVLYYRNLLICKITGKPGEIIEASEEILEKLKKQGGDMDQDELIHIIKELSSLESGFKWSTHPRVLLEVSLIKVCGNYFKADDSDISGRLAKLEQMVSSADFAAKSEVYGNNIGSNKESNVREGNEMKLPPSSQSVSYNSIECNSKGLEFWESVLTELKNSGRVAIYTNLIGTKAVELDSKFVGIVFNARSDFQKTMVSKVENAEVVEGLLNKRLGREVRIKCVDEATTSGGKKDKIKEGKDEFEEKAQNIAKRLNTPFNVIDE